MDVHVWRILLPIETAVKNRLQKTLSQDELSRLKTFHFEIDRERTLVARGGLRDILARYLNKTPSDIVFQYTEFGKPTLKNIILNFNVSHANNCILIAITKHMRVGIDVEYHKSTLEHLSIAKKFFTQKEYAHLLILPSDERNVTFYHYWTQKEAFLKGIGLGLQIPLNQLDISENNEWQFSNINPGIDYIATLATSEKHNKISLWNWEK